MPESLSAPDHAFEPRAQNKDFWFAQMQTKLLDAEYKAKGGVDEARAASARMDALENTLMMERRDLEMAKAELIERAYMVRCVGCDAAVAVLRRRKRDHFYINIEK